MSTLCHKPGYYPIALFKAIQYLVLIFSVVLERLFHFRSGVMKNSSWNVKIESKVFGTMQELLKRFVRKQVYLETRQYVIMFELRWSLSFKITKTVVRGIIFRWSLNWDHNLWNVIHMDALKYRI